jgi:hypothetical protein
MKWVGRPGLTPHGSWPLRDQGVGEAAEQIGLGTSCREGETNAAGRLGDTGGDFEKPEPDRCELGRGQITRLRDGVAHSEDEPIGGGVENEADLVGERRAAVVRSEASWDLCSLIRFSACPRAQ